MTPHTLFLIIVDKSRHVSHLTQNCINLLTSCHTSKCLGLLLNCAVCLKCKQPHHAFEIMYTFWQIFECIITDRRFLERFFDTGNCTFKKTLKGGDFYLWCFYISSSFCHVWYLLAVTIRILVQFLFVAVEYLSD